MYVDLTRSDEPRADFPARVLQIRSVIRLHEGPDIDVTQRFGVGDHGSI